MQERFDSAIKYQRTGTRHRTLRRPKVRDTVAHRQFGRDQEGSKADTQRPAHNFVQWLAERRNLGVDNRRDRSRRKANPEADQHEREYRMACAAATSC